MEDITNIVNLIRLFKNRHHHLVKFLIENNAFNQNFIEKVVNNDRLSQINEFKTFHDIGEMNDYFESLINDGTGDYHNNINDKLDKLIREEKYEDAARIRDYMIKNNIKRRGIF